MAFAGSSGDGEFGQLVPADVVQALSSDIPEQVRLTAAEFAGDDSGSPDFSGQLAAVSPRTVSTFEPATADTALIANGEWTAALVRGGEVVGTVTVWRQNGQVELNGYDDDVTLGQALVESSAAVLISDAPIGAYYLYDGAVVTPANEPAHAQVAGPAPLSEVRQVVNERNAAAGAESGPDSVGGMRPTEVVGDVGPGEAGGTVVGVVCLAVGLGLLSFWLLRRPRRVA